MLSLKLRFFSWYLWVLDSRGICKSAKPEISLQNCDLFQIEFQIHLCRLHISKNLQKNILNTMICSYSGETISFLLLEKHLSSVKSFLISTAKHTQPESSNMDHLHWYLQNFQRWYLTLWENFIQKLALYWHYRTSWYVRASFYIYLTHCILSLRSLPRRRPWKRCR